MSLRSRFSKQCLTSYFVNGALFLGMILYASYVFAHASGMTGVTKKNGDGCTCHGSSPTTAVGVTISGPAELTPGQTGNYTVTVQGGPGVRAGTDIAVSGGTLNPSSAALQKIGDELTQASPQPFSSGTVTFPFTYTAPTAAGTYTIYANGNSVNFNGGTSGDQWNFAPDKVVTVKSATGVENSSTAPREFALSQNYPNPFNPSTTITYNVARTGQILISVYDLSGRLVTTLVDGVREPGTYNVRFTPRGLASGAYFYTLRVDGTLIQTKKLALQK